MYLNFMYNFFVGSDLDPSQLPIAIGTQPSQLFQPGWKRIAFAGHTVVLPMRRGDRRKPWRSASKQGLAEKLAADSRNSCIKTIDYGIMEFSDEPIIFAIRKTKSHFHGIFRFRAPD